MLVDEHLSSVICPDRKGVPTQCSHCEKKINMKGEIKLGVLSEMRWEEIKELMVSKC